ncbi:MAG: hypothetical protein PHX22_11910 [Dysgonamonadaceae bacterium]|jgi:hypothetical protein|nr:hypothetical protein [Fermentimonas sp.]MDD3901918.1 hypothetical protein [Dysgonamonadaceae bacterium]
MNARKNFLTITLALALMFSTIGCDLFDTPDSAVDNYLTAIENLDIETAAQYVKEQDSAVNQTNIADDPEGEKILKAITQKISHEIISSRKSGNTAQVVTRITSPDMMRIVSSVMSDLIPMAFASAFSEDPNNDNSDQLAQQYFMNAIMDPNLPLTTQEVTINLIEENGKWVILADDNLANAITGNLGKLSESLNSIKWE